MTYSMKPIPNFNGLYSATTKGTIYSHRTHKELKPKRHYNGYLAVCLVNSSGKHIDALVHRLVCLAFHGQPTSEQTDVNHIDHDKANNRPENLEWCTRSENMAAAVLFGAMDAQREAVSQANKLRRKAVVGIDSHGNEIVRYDSVTEARRNGYAKVSDVLLGHRKTAGGLSWQYA